MFWSPLDDMDNQTTSDLRCQGRSDHIQCQHEEPYCYESSQTCVYDTVITDYTTENSVMTLCRDGTHLRTNCGNCFL